MNKNGKQKLKDNKKSQKELVLYISLLTLKGTVSHVANDPVCLKSPTNIVNLSQTNLNRKRGIPSHTTHRTCWLSPLFKILTY